MAFVSPMAYQHTKNELYKLTIYKKLNQRIMFKQDNLCKLTVTDKKYSWHVKKSYDETQPQFKYYIWCGQQESNLQEL